MFTALAATACASGSRWDGLTAAELFEVGRGEYDSGDYGDAVQTLERLLLGNPGFEQAAEAQIMLARAYFLDEQFILAQSEFTRFLDRYPAHPQAPAAALGVCRSNESLSPISQRDQTFTEQAVQVCRNVAADWQGTAQGDSAATVAVAMRAKLAKKQYDTGLYYLDHLGVPDAAILYWEDLVANFPETEWAPAALAGIIDAYTRIGYEDEVEATKQRLVEAYPESPQAREVGVDGGDPAGGG